jgi:ABC-type glycerol-3-phosphate transport system substrate-binding protein
MRKVALLVLLVTAVLVIGAASAQDMSGIDPSGQTVVYWHQFRDGSAQQTAMNAIIEDFNTNNEWGITVEGTAKGGYSDIQAAMETAIQSGEMPNLVAGFANAAASWGFDGVVVDLWPYANDPTWGFSAEELADVNPALLALNTLNYDPYDNTLIAWPNQVSAQVMVTNLDMAEALGFEGAPTTFAEFKDLACAAAAMEGDVDVKGYGFSGDSSEFEAFVAANGGNIWDAEAGQYTFTTPEVVEVFQLFQDLYSEGCGYFSDQAFGWQADFNIGANVMFQSSTAGYTFIIDGFTDYTANWGISLFPTGEGDAQILQAYSPAIALLTSTPEAQLASWLFLKHMSNVESQIAWSTGTGYFPLRISATESLEPDDFARPDIYPYYTQALGYLNDADLPKYFSPNLISYNGVRGLISEAVQNVTTNGMDVNEVAAGVEEEANALLEE